MKITEAKQVREGVYKAIFASLFVKQTLTSNEDTCNFWCIDVNDKLVYDKTNILSFLDENNNFNDEVKNSICSFLDCYINNLNNFNKSISTHLKENFTLDMLAKSDLAIIYTALTELYINIDLSEKIIVSEAVELAKKYSSENAYKFINGILRNIAKELRNNEWSCIYS